jgi:mannonate dehydratase
MLDGALGLRHLSAADSRETFMLRIAEFIDPTPNPVWRLAQQCGVTAAVGGLPFTMLEANERVCDLAPLTRMKQRYEAAGFTLEVIEARPPLNKAKRGLPGRDEEIDVACTLIENMGKLGIPVWCYEWMTDFNWLRTNTATRSRGGSVVTSFDAADVPADITSNPPISENELWDNLDYFLRRVLPVAERAGVKLSMHPDDPPITPIRGVSRIMRSIDNFHRLIDMLPSPMNTITLCQGNFTLMTDDLPGEIRRFGDKISFVHFRDVRGVPTRFEEAWHDAGKTDMLACMRAYRDIGFDGVLRPDHVPTVEGDSNTNAGYSAFGRLYAIGYIRGLREAVYGDVIQ